MPLEKIVYLNNCNWEKCSKKRQNSKKYDIVRAKKAVKRGRVCVIKWMGGNVDKYVENVEKCVCNVVIYMIRMSYSDKNSDGDVKNDMKQ
jgi:hypothetical protein